jgi:hypothetical protein
MVYDTWDWSPVTGSGMPSGFMPDRVDPDLAQEAESGVITSEPQYTAGHWVFDLEFSMIRPWSWIWLIDWKHLHRGKIPFYWRFPYEMAGIPPGAELADPGGITPWSSEIAVMAGYGPTYLVVWMNDNLKVSRKNHANNYWSTTGAIQLRSI